MCSKFNIFSSATGTEGKRNLMLASYIWGNRIAHPLLLHIQAILKIICAFYV